MSEFEQASNKFIEWLKANKAFISNDIEIKDYRMENAGRGVVATKEIKEGDLLFSLPRNVLLSEETSELAKLPKMKQILNTLDGWGPLILCLMYESKLNNSFWKPYLDILPKTFTTPMFWDTNDLKELTGTGVIDKIGREDAETMFKETILPIIKNNPDVFDENIHDLSLFHICGSLIMAYSFHDEMTVKASTSSEKDDNGHKSDSDSEEEDEEPQSIIAMVPMADMLNHRTGFNNARLFHEPDCLQMRAIKDIKAQEQIYNTYGDLCNADLLRKYGFIDVPNEYDIVEISGDMVRDVCCPPDQTEDEKEAKVTFLLDEEVLDDYFVIESNGDIPPELLVCAQVFTMSSKDFSTCLEKRKLPKPKMSSIIDTLLSKRLEAYGSDSIEDDEKKLMLSKSSDSTLPINVFNAIQVRLGEKRILQKLLTDKGPERKKQRKK